MARQHVTAPAQPPYSAAPGFGGNNGTTGMPQPFNGTGAAGNGHNYFPMALSRGPSYSPAAGDMNAATADSQSSVDSSNKNVGLYSYAFYVIC